MNLNLKGLLKGKKKVYKSTINAAEEAQGVLKGVARDSTEAQVHNLMNQAKIRHDIKASKGGAHKAQAALDFERDKEDIIKAIVNKKNAGEKKEKMYKATNVIGALGLAGVAGAAYLKNKELGQREQLINNLSNPVSS